MNDRILPELGRNALTDMIFDEYCFEGPINPESAEEVIEGINLALEMEERSAFLCGLAERLTELGTKCSEDDTEVMLAAVKERYKRILGKACPKAVVNWCKGVTPGITNRANNYDLCFALEMNFKQTAIFFQKNFLTIPYNAKSRIDAVYLYCLSHNKPYEYVDKFLGSAESFVEQEEAHTETARIMDTICKIKDDEAFLEYLSKHCYGSKQQYQLAKSIINKEIDVVKENLVKDNTSRDSERFSATRLNSLTIDAIFGFKYQGSKHKLERKLPRRFTESLPNDVTLGQIINGETVSYETLRKSLMLFKFYNFYLEADNEDVNSIVGNLLDFNDEINGVLSSCGFAEVYVRHPFDCLLMYCANSYDPISALQYVFENGRN